jgi:hypothetical protein
MGSGYHVSLVQCATFGGRWLGGEDDNSLSFWSFSHVFDGYVK